jgi:hypothetical protein
MEGTFYPGQHYSIRNDILVGGQVAFRAGQPVVLVKISTNPQRPEYQFVVYSDSLGTSFQLRAEDLGPPVVVAAPDQFGKPPVGPAVRPAARQLQPRGKNKSIEMNKALFIALGIIVVVVVGYFGFKLLKGTGGPETVTRRLFGYAQERDLKGMLSTFDKTALVNDPTVPGTLSQYFLGGTQAGPRPGTVRNTSMITGVGFAAVLTYSATVTGDTAKVVVSAPARYVRSQVDTPLGQDVPIATVSLIKKGGGWFVTSIALSF